MEGNGVSKHPSEIVLHRVKGVAGSPIAEGLARLTAFLVRDEAQPRFAFARRGEYQLPADLQVILELGQILRDLAARDAELNQSVDQLRQTLANAPGGRTYTVNGDDVAARVGSIERELSFLGEVLEENTKLRQRDFQFGVLGPIALDVIEAIDGLDSDLASISRTGAAASSPREAKLCKDIGERITIRRDDLLSMLSRRAIERFVTPLLAPMEPGKHKPFPPRVPHVSGRKGCIAKHMRPGYWRASDAWVVRPQWVEVFGEDLESTKAGKGQS